MEKGYAVDDALQAKVVFDQAIADRFVSKLQGHVKTIKLNLANGELEAVIRALISFGEFLQRELLADSLESMEKKLTPYMYLFENMELHDLALLPMISDARIELLANNQDDQETKNISNFLRIGSNCYTHLLPPKFDAEMRKDYPEDTAIVDKAKECVLRLIKLRPPCCAFNRALQEYLYYQTREKEVALIAANRKLAFECTDGLANTMETFGSFTIRTTRKKLERIGKIAERLLIGQEHSASDRNASIPLAIYYGRKLDNNKQELISEEQDNINTTIYAVDKHADRLWERGFFKEAKVAHGTSVGLRQKTDAYYAIDKKDRALVTMEYKKQCTAKLKKADKTLSVHRGWKKIFGNVLLAIAGVGVGYLIAGGIKKALTGRFWFFDKTASSEKLDDFKQEIAHKAVA